MKNVSVVYATKTQHSRKLAEAIGKALGAKANNAVDCLQPEETGLHFLIGGIYAGKCSPELISYAEKLDASIANKVVLVTSSVSIAQRSQKELHKLFEKKGIEVVEEITCTGGFLFVKASHPNQQDLQTVVAAAKEIIEKIQE